MHDFSVTIPRCYKDIFVSSLFPHTARLWNSLPMECFPLKCFECFPLNAFLCSVKDIIGYIFSNVYQITPVVSISIVYQAWQGSVWLKTHLTMHLRLLLVESSFMVKTYWISNCGMQWLFFKKLVLKYVSLEVSFYLFTPSSQNLLKIKSNQFKCNKM